jgi:hypothetical protein
MAPRLVIFSELARSSAVVQRLAPINDLANGVMADDYCPNAFTLDALLKAKQ